MGLICNGCMVSGTHILLKAAELFGYHRIHGAVLPSGFSTKYFYKDQNLPGHSLQHYYKGKTMTHKEFEKSFDIRSDGVVHAHCPGYKTRHKQLVIIRDPRSMLAARTKKIWNQYDAVKGKPWKPHLRKQMTGNKPHDALIVLREGNILKEVEAMKKTSGFHVDFETVFLQESVDDMAEYLGKEPFDASLLYGGTPTFTGTKTDWREYWSPEIGELFDAYENSI